MKWKAWVSCVLLSVISPLSSLAQQGASVSMTVDTTSLRVGNTVEVAVSLDLHGHLSLGGYVDLNYDPRVFECIQIANNMLFGMSGTAQESCQNTGVLRISSRVPGMNNTVQFSGPKLFATVALKATEPTDRSAIRFVSSSQIFGTRGGDILIDHDDSATQQIVVYDATPPIPPGPGGGNPSAIPEPSTLILIGLGLLGLLGVIRRKGRHLWFGCLVFAVSMIVSSEILAQEQFEYSRNSNTVIIELSQDINMLVDSDPTPLLRIYGDGRVQIHYPVYMKKAGDYSMKLSEQRMKQLLSFLLARGLLEFEPETIRKQIEDINHNRRQQALATGKQRVLTERLDETTTIIRINLESYQPQLPAGKSSLRKNVVKEISWHGLRGAIKDYPELEVLQNLAAAENALLALAEDSNLIEEGEARK